MLLGLGLMGTPPSSFSATARRAAAPCPAGGPEGFDRVFHYVTGFPKDPLLHRDLDTVRIQSLSGWRQLGYWQNPGLTRGGHEIKTDFRMSGMQRSSSPGTCAWVENLTITFDYTELDVYVSSDYADGSCEARQILLHEMEHVAVHRRAYARHQAVLLRRIRALGLPTPAHPKRYRNLSEAQRGVGSLLKRVTESEYEAFKRELAAGNAKLDTIQNYRAIQKRCNHWK
jgi:hypothetical protein